MSYLADRINRKLGSEDLLQFTFLNHALLVSSPGSKEKLLSKSIFKYLALYDLRYLEQSSWHNYCCLNLAQQKPENRVHWERRGEKSAHASVKLKVVSLLRSPVITLVKWAIKTVIAFGLQCPQNRSQQLHVCFLMAPAIFLSFCLSALPMATASAAEKQLHLQFLRKDYRPAPIFTRRLA